LHRHLHPRTTGFPRREGTGIIQRNMPGQDVCDEALYRRTARLERENRNSLENRGPVAGRPFLPVISRSVL
jgi:hypothetical protein